MARPLSANQATATPSRDAGAHSPVAKGRDAQTSEASPRVALAQARGSDCPHPRLQRGRECRAGAPDGARGGRSCMCRGIGSASYGARAGAGLHLIALTTQISSPARMGSSARTPRSSVVSEMYSLGALMPRVEAHSSNGGGGAHADTFDRNPAAPTECVCSTGGATHVVELRNTQENIPLYSLSEGQCQTHSRDIYVSDTCGLDASR